MRKSFLLTALAIMLLALVCPARVFATPPAVPGVVVSWGRQSIPLSVYDGQQLLMIAGSGYRSLSLKSDGTVVAWGANWFGQSSVPTGLGNDVKVV